MSCHTDEGGCASDIDSDYDDDIPPRVIVLLEEVSLGSSPASDGASVERAIINLFDAAIPSDFKPVYPKNVQDFLNELAGTFNQDFKLARQRLEAGTDVFRFKFIVGKIDCYR